MNNRIGQARREYAGKHGKFSQKDAAEYFGVSLSTYQKWEQGQGMMNGEQLRAIAEKYETTTDFLLSRTDISYAYIVVPKDVDDDERELADILQTITPEGRRQLMIYARGIASTYSKNNQVEQTA